VNTLSPLHALLLCGGESRRMGQAKALIRYWQLPQYQHLAQMITPLVDTIWVSCREEQAAFFPDMPLILDQKKWGHIGPINGLCTAFSQVHTVSWLVLGCDYPLLQPIDIQHLIAHRTPGLSAIAYQNSESGHPEPLLAIYEAHTAAALQSWREEGNQSLRLFLQNNNTRLVQPLDSTRLISVDTAEIAQKLNLRP
jgi:molybdenum cofactor guanylyltransferase